MYNESVADVSKLTSALITSSVFVDPPIAEPLRCCCSRSPYPIVAPQQGGGMLYSDRVQNVAPSPTLTLHDKTTAFRTLRPARPGLKHHAKNSSLCRPAAHFSGNRTRVSICNISEERNLRNACRSQHGRRCRCWFRSRPLSRCSCDRLGRNRFSKNPQRTCGTLFWQSCHLDVRRLIRSDSGMEHFRVEDGHRFCTRNKRSSVVTGCRGAARVRPRHEGNRALTRVFHVAM